MLKKHQKGTLVKLQPFHIAVTALEPAFEKLVWAVAFVYISYFIIVIVIFAYIILHRLFRVRKR